MSSIIFEIPIRGIEACSTSYPISALSNPPYRKCKGKCRRCILLASGAVAKVKGGEAVLEVGKVEGMERLFGAEEAEDGWRARNLDGPV